MAITYLVPATGLLLLLPLYMIGQGIPVVSLGLTLGVAVLVLRA